MDSFSATTRWIFNFSTAKWAQGWVLYEYETIWLFSFRKMFIFGKHHVISPQNRANDGTRLTSTRRKPWLHCWSTQRPSFKERKAVRARVLHRVADALHRLRWTPSIWAAWPLTLVRLLCGLISVLELRNGIQFVLSCRLPLIDSVDTIAKHSASEQHGP